MTTKAIKFDLKEISRIYRSSVDYGDIVALQNLTLTLEGGAVTAIIGPSGCGKTTLLNIISGVDQQDSGTILVNGQLLNRLDLRFGYMFQTPSLIPWRTVLQNAILGCEIRGESNESSEARARELLKRYGLGEFLTRYPVTLSIGMQQRVALARLILYGADALLLDEPFRGLDYWIKRQLQRDLASVIEEREVTTILVTHDIEEAVSLADCVCVLSQRPAQVVAKHRISLSRRQRLSADPRVIREMTSIFADVWRDLQKVYADAEAVGL